jgi:PAS domain S-box-containing protein
MSDSTSDLAQSGSLRHAIVTGGYRFAQFLPWLVLAASLTITYLLWKNEQQNVIRDLQIDFDFRVREADDRINQRMKAYEQILQGVNGLFAASDRVSRGEFREYVNTLRLADNFSGAQGIGYLQIVPPAQKSNHIAAVRKEGFPSYTIKPEGERGFYTSVVYVEPFVGGNLRDFGMDMYMNPVLRPAMEQARDTGNMAISGKVLVRREADEDRRVQPGFLMFLPVYRNGAPHATEAERRANIVGWIYASFRMMDLMAGILGESATEIDIEIYDGGEMSEKALMYDPELLMYDPDLSGAGGNSQAQFQKNSRIAIAGHYWTTAIRSLYGFEIRANREKPQFIAYTGIGASLMLALLIWLLLYGRLRVMESSRALIESEASLQALVDNALDAVVRMDADGNITDWNSQAEKIFGWLREEAIGQPLHELIIPPQYRKAHVGGLTHFLSTHKGKMLDSRVEISALHHSGHEFPVELSITSASMWGRHEFTAFIRDITTIKHAEEALMQSEKRFRMIFESANDGMMLLSMAGLIMDINRIAHERLGYTKEEMLGKPIADFDSPEYAPRVAERIAEVKSHGWGGFESAHMHRDGTVIPVEINARIIELNGQPVCLSVLRDITERKRAEEELRLAAIAVNTVDDAVLVTDADNRIITVNPAFTKITGYVADEVLGKNPRILSSGRHSKEFYRELWETLLSTGSWHGEICDRRKNGELYNKWLSIKLVRDDKGRLTHHVAVFSEVSWHKPQEQSEP